MLVTAPFAGPVSFPLLVIKDKLSFRLENSCKTNEVGDVVLDSITNYPKNYEVAAGVYINMYSVIGNLESSKVFTVRKGTLADYNARLLGREVINTTPEEAVMQARKGYLALVGIEVREVLNERGVSFSEYISRLGLLGPSCMIYTKPNVDVSQVLEAYKEGIEVIKRDPERSAVIISRLSEYYQENIMKRIIREYNHKLTLNRSELEKAKSVYERVKQELIEMKIRV
ncbi:MAG: DUF3834 domain-containing protein [Saccharolobus sp.]|uniref:DUF3834 domain-containing protein n=1 Tax=Saccharolobus TaxID=2100760 RepID=UPI001F0DDC90|nr:DUF3834 domain-containing protein [Saccharolobus shibatae]MCH4816530.1 DUF3834 domain-containing protein [Saccharolobus shibatae]